MISVANVIEDGRLAGPQIRIADVAARLKARGVRTVVVVPEQESGPFRTRLAAGSTEICTLPLHRPERRLPGLLRYLVYFPWEVLLLYRHFRMNEYSVVHCSGGAWQVKGVIAAWLCGTRVVWHLNDSSMPWFVRLSFRVLSHMADVFVVAGARVKEYYLGQFSISKPIVEIQAPVDCSIFDPKKVIASKQLSRNKLNVVLVANINPLKGIEYFIEMAFKLNQVTKDALEYYIVGPVYESQTSYAKKLRVIVERANLGNVHFLGPTSDVASILSATDIYVCSSVAEASPIAVWEAMSMARAIVSTDVGDVRRFLVNGVAGYVVPPRSSEDLAKAVGLLVADAELRAQFGRKAREVALQNLDITICVEKHFQTYSSLIRSSDSVAGA